MSTVARLFRVTFGPVAASPQKQIEESAFEREPKEILAAAAGAIYFRYRSPEETTVARNSVPFCTLVACRLYAKNRDGGEGCGHRLRERRRDLSCAGRSRGRYWTAREIMQIVTEYPSLNTRRAPDGFQLFTRSHASRGRRLLSRFQLITRIFLFLFFFSCSTT